MVSNDLNRNYKQLEEIYKLQSKLKKGNTETIFHGFSFTKSVILRCKKLILKKNVFSNPVHDVNVSGMRPEAVVDRCKQHTRSEERKKKEVNYTICWTC